MLFISNNKKIDAVIKKLQPRLKLKINVERDFDCGLNDVFEKRPDVVFIQNQISGVTGESVARHIQLLLGGAAPKFIFIHDGDAKAKPKKGLYEYLIDLSQNEEAVAADILDKLNLLLGPQWQNIFLTSVFQGVDYEAFTPAPCPPREPDSSFLFDVVPGTESVVPGPAPSGSSLSLKSEIAPDEAFDVIPATFGHYSELLYEECKELEEKVAATVSGEAVSAAEQFRVSSQSASSIIDSELSAGVPEASISMATGLGIIARKAETSEPAVVISGVGAKKTLDPTENFSLPLKSVVTEHNPPVTATVTPGLAEKHQVRPSTFTERGVIKEEATPVKAQDERQWVFEGEPRLKKTTWKWYQVVELILVLCLLVGGWYLVTQKPNFSEPVANEVNLLASASSPQITEKSVPAAQQPLLTGLPSFIPLAGHDPVFATQNPGWERYAAAGSEFRLFRENGKLKAVQVKAEKGRVISDSLLKSILVELAGTGEYRVKSQELKQGFQVLNATVNGKAELLIYRKKSLVYAFVVSLD